MTKLKFLFVFIFCAFFVFPAAADDTKTNNYSPDYCGFSVTFPSEPYMSRRCDEGNDKNCYDLISFTKVFNNLEATVNFRVICNPIDQQVYDHYNEDVMKTTLAAMTKRSVVKTFDTSYRKEDVGYKQAGLVGEGQSGTLPTLYIAQLWISSGSALSVEGELIGEATEDADKLFSDVLKSVHFLTPEEQKAKKPVEAKDDEEKDDKEEQKEEKTEEKDKKE